MRLSELDPRVESPSLLPLFPCTLDPGGKFKNLGFMRVSRENVSIEQKKLHNFEKNICKIRSFVLYYLT